MPPIAVLIALADPTRCRIIEILRDGPQPVHLLAGSFQISRPAISRHLRVLKQARLISEKKAGRENRYALHGERLGPVAEWLAAMRDSQALGAQPAQDSAPARAAPKKSAPRQVATRAASANAPDVVAPAVATGDMPAVLKLRKSPPASQMGFDF